MTDTRDLFDIDIVKQAAEMAGQHAATQGAQAWWWTVQFALRADSESIPKLESPAEAVFELWFTASQFWERRFALRRQVDVESHEGRYRFDFVITLFDFKTLLPIAVEIDGHAWHEKTLEQATYRNRRDRAVQQAGYRVLHFSFSELMRDPLNCVLEVTQAAQRWISEENDRVAEAKDK